MNKSEERCSSSNLPHEEAEQHKPYFFLLPAVLQKEVLKRIGGAAILLISTVIVLITTKEWLNCFGFLFALFLAYLGIDIIQKFKNGKIMVARMVVSKARKWRKSGRIHVILRDASITDITTQEVQTYSCQISASLKDRFYITSGTVLNIYVSESSPNAVLAYEILGELP